LSLTSNLASASAAAISESPETSVSIHL
jgi:hypothetical protein